MKSFSALWRHQVSSKIRSVSRCISHLTFLGQKFYWIYSRNIYLLGRCNLAIPEVITSCANLTEIKSIRSSQCSISTEKSNLSNPANILNSSRSVQTLGNELSCLSEYSHESRPCSISSKLELLERISRSSRERTSPRTPVTPDTERSEPFYNSSQMDCKPERGQNVLVDRKPSDDSSKPVRLESSSNDNGKIRVPSKVS